MTCQIIGVNQLMFFHSGIFYFPNFMLSLFLNLFLVLLFIVNVYFQSIDRLILFVTCKIVDHLTGAHSILCKNWGNSNWVVKGSPCTASVANVHGIRRTY
jgi:hypothetical protein